MATTTRYILYARKSSEAEDKQVASVPSQVSELLRFAQENNLNVIETISDEKSAKAPNAQDGAGRPVKREGFDRMISIIASGGADGILCWKLDRLARNPVDAGAINWMLQQGTIQNIRCIDREYKSSDNVIMMMVEFGMANQFIRDLSVNTKRGLRAKVAKGWMPFLAPIGYTNRFIRKGENDIVPDPERFNKVKKLWHELIHHHPSMKELHRYAKNKLNLTTSRGTGMVYSKFLKMFSNPFYYGYFRYNGELYKGNHVPMISKSEWDMAQGIVHTRHKTRKQRYSFPYTGLIRCGECGSMVTAEEKYRDIKSGGVHIYHYYHCTKVYNRACTQKPVKEELIEGQILDYLSRVEISPRHHQLVLRVLQEDMSKTSHILLSDRKNHEKDLRRVMANLDILIKKNINGMITDEEFIRIKKEYNGERAKIEDLLKSSGGRVTDWLAKADRLLNYAEKAKTTFMKGSIESKKQMLLFLGQNFLLKDNTLSIEVLTTLIKLKGLEKGLPSQDLPIEQANMLEKEEVSKQLRSNIVKWGG